MTVMSEHERAAMAARWRETALSYEARARRLREDGDPVHATEYDEAAGAWRAAADNLELFGPAAVDADRIA